jgi:hypothetical protein
MYKVQFLDSQRWIEVCSGYGEQHSISNAMCYAESNPERRVRIIFEQNGQQSVVFFV